MKNGDVAILILYNKQKRMLLQHRSDYKKRRAGYWGAFGGHIETNEPIEKALAREIREELSCFPQFPFLVPY